MFFGTLCQGNLLAQEAVRIGGTGSGTLLIQRLVESYAKTRPDTRLSVVMPPLGSHGGLRALAAGSIQIAVIAAVPGVPPDLTAYPGLGSVIPWVRTPLVFSGKDLAINAGITLPIVMDIYTGKVTHWPDGKPIRLITRSDRETETKILRAVSPKMNDAVSIALKRMGLPFAENDLDNQRMLEKTPGSFGIIPLGQILLSNSPLQAISLGGVVPTPDNLQTGKYRLEKECYLVLGATANLQANAFVEYLRTPEALEILGRFGFIPLRSQ